MLGQEIGSLETVPSVNHFKRVTFSVDGIDIAATSQKRNFNKEKVNLAVRQALGLWSAVAPVDFQSPIVGEKAAIRIHFVKDGNKSEEVGLTGGSILNGGIAIISMDCDNQLFIDRFLEADQFPGNPSFDLIGFLGHEVGHALGLDHIPGGLMQASLNTGVLRRLFPPDIREVQKLHGALHLATTAKANLADTAQLINASPGIVLQKGAFGLVVFGPMETKTLLDVLVPAKGLVANALRLKYTTVTANVFVNQVETFDGLIPIQRFAVSSRSSIDAGLAGKRSNLQFGFVPRRPMRNDMLVRIEIHFTKKDGHPASDFGVVQVDEVSVETIS